MGASAQDLAVEELYLRHQAALRRFLARMLRCEETAVEVAQEAWLRMIRLAPGCTLDEPRAYLFQVAANAARDHMARERTRATVVEAGPMPEAVPCPEPDAETAAIARERLRLLAAAGAAARSPPGSASPATWSRSTSSAPCCIAAVALTTPEDSCIFPVRSRRLQSVLECEGGHQPTVACRSKVVRRTTTRQVATAG